MLFIVQLMLGVVILMTSINRTDMSKKRTIQIDVIGLIEETELMKCKLYVDGRVCVIGMSRYDYEELMREKVFIRDGKSVDSAGVINTTNTFIEKD